MRIPRPQEFEKMVKIVDVDGFFWSPRRVQLEVVLQRCVVVLDRIMLATVVHKDKDLE